MNFARASEKLSLAGVSPCRNVADEAGDCGRRKGEERAEPDPYPNGDGRYAEGVDCIEGSFVSAVNWL